MRIFFDMDGVQATWTPVEFEEQLFEKGFYRNLTPNGTVMKAIEELNKNGYEVFTLSKYLDNSKYALSEKQEWAKENTPSIQNDHLLWVKYADDKSDYIPDGIQKDDYLIDDYSPNLFEFEKAGGQAIKLMNGINGTKGTWKGNKVEMNSQNLFNDIVSTIESDMQLRNEKSNEFNNQKKIDELDFDK